MTSGTGQGESSVMVALRLGVDIHGGIQGVHGRTQDARGRVATIHVDYGVLLDHSLLGCLRHSLLFADLVRDITRITIKIGVYRVSVSNCVEGVEVWFSR